jgi:hypothetical protein
VDLRDGLNDLSTGTQSVMALLAVASLWPEDFPEHRVTVDTLITHTRYLGTIPANVQHALDRARPEIERLLSPGGLEPRKRGRHAGYALRQPHDRDLDNWLYDSGWELLTSSTWERFIDAQSKLGPHSHGTMIAGILETVARELDERGEIDAAQALLAEWLDHEEASLEPIDYVLGLLGGLAKDAPLDDIATLSSRLHHLEGLCARLGLMSADDIDRDGLRRFLRYVALRIKADTAASLSEWNAVLKDLDQVLQSFPITPTFHDRLLRARLYLVKGMSLLHKHSGAFAEGPIPSDTAHAINDCLHQASMFTSGLDYGDRGTMCFLEAALLVRRSPQSEDARMRQAVRQFQRAFHLYHMAGDTAGMVWSCPGSVDG